MLLLAACLLSAGAACSRKPSSVRAHPEAGPGAVPDSASPAAGDVGQGIAGRFEAIGGAHPPDPGCENLVSPPARDSCERAFLRQMMWPLRGFVVIRDAGGDSVRLELDSLGGYRATLPPGRYSVCVQAEGVDFRDSCGDSVVVAPGKFTPYSRPFPMP